MSLSLLPAELKLDIFDYLDPGSVLPFALSSRAHFKLCEDRLQQHAKLSAKYSVIQPNDEGHLIWEITKEILQDPRKGWYVRELNLVTNRPDKYQNMPEGDRIFFRAAIERILPFYSYASGFFANERSDARELSDEMHDDLREGFEASILVLLVHHSPQLRTFRMTDNVMSDTFQLFMRWVAAAYQNPSMAPQMPLQHLRLAAIAHHDTEGCCSVDWAVYFLCIPSLKTFAAFMMGSEAVRMYGEDSEADLRITTSAPVSNVEELFFQECRFDPDSFDTILPIIKTLKRFSYDAGGHTVVHQNHEPKKVIRALVNHTADSLEELNLADDTTDFEDGEDEICWVSARDFKKLKALHCESWWLLSEPGDLSTDINSEASGAFSEDHSSVDDPRDNLPDSLEYLYLDVHREDEWRDMVKIFETKNANTPKLTLENTCIDRYNVTKYGRAVEPHIRFANPLFDDIWSGHSYFL